MPDVHSASEELAEAEVSCPTCEVRRTHNIYGEEPARHSSVARCCVGAVMHSELIWQIGWKRVPTSWSVTVGCSVDLQCTPPPRRRQAFQAALTTAGPSVDVVCLVRN